MKITKKILTILLTGILLFSLVGCQGGDTDNPGNTGDTENTDNAGNTDVEKTAVDIIKEKGKVVMATSADYPPFEFQAISDGVQTIEGFDIYIAEEIAKDLGVELEIIDLDFSTLIAALNAGKADMVLAAVTPDDERREEVDFSDLYYLATQAVITKKGNEGEIKSLEDLNGKVIGVQQGTIQADIANDTSLISDPKEIREVPKITDLILMVQTGKVDAIIMEMPVAESYAKVNENLAVADVEYTDPDGGFAVALKKNNSEFVELVNATLDRLENENKIEEFFIKASEIAEQQQ